MRSLLPSCALLPGALLFAASLPAQGTSPTPAPTNPTSPPATAAAAPAGAEIAAAKARLQGALQKCGALADTGFQVAWGPDATKQKKENDGFTALLQHRMSGAAKGSWHADRLHVAFDGDTADELVLAGRRTLAKAAGAEWRLRTGRFADGNKCDFVPDPALLLQLLSRWDLAVTQRSVGSLDDRPVEILSVTLSADQVAEAAWSGALPELLTQPGASGGVFRFAAAGGAGNGQRPAATVPESTIDLAIHLDPATNLVHQVRVRGWTKQGAGVMRAGAGNNVVIVQGGALQARGGADDEDEDEANQPEKDGPLTYTDGLPVRPRAKQTVCDYTIRLLEHGKRQAPPLTAAQQQLLGR